MFGHPGISAFEFAGAQAEQQEEAARAARAASISGKPSTRKQTSISATSAATIESDSADVHLVLQEQLQLGQRPRGSFINHTPRRFEIVTVRKDDSHGGHSVANPLQQHPVNETGSRVISASTHISQHSSRVSSGVGEGDYKVILSPKDHLDHPYTGLSSRQRYEAVCHGPGSEPGSRSTSATYRIARKPLKVSLKGPFTSPVSSAADEKAERTRKGGMSDLSQRDPKKRERRQTPYRITGPRGLRPVPPSIHSGRYSPLEPWVARHQHEVSKDTETTQPDERSRSQTFHSGKQQYTDDQNEPKPEEIWKRRSSLPSFLPSPAVEGNADLMASDEEGQTLEDIENIGALSAYRAIQEYFESQQASAASSNKGSHQSFGEGKSRSLSSSPVAILAASPTRAGAERPSLELDIPSEPVPELPERSPKRLTTSLSAEQGRGASAASDASNDFNSAARGTYSAYDDKDDRVSSPEPQSPLRFQNVAGSSTVGKMPPPVSSNTEVGKEHSRFALSDYLRNTGPGPSLQQQVKKKRSGLKLFGLRGKKSLADRVGSVEGSPANAPRMPSIPSCAKEMFTSSGKRHLYITVDPAYLDNNQTVTLPVDSSDPHRAKHVSIIWTDEMLNSPVSPALEQAMGNFDATSEDSQPASPTAARSPRREPVEAKPVPVAGENHPLATRQEQTRARKLRDLKKKPKQQETDAIREATLAALPTPVQSCESLASHRDGDMEHDGWSTPDLRQKVIALQKQNSQLAQALAGLIGFKPETDGELDPHAVLQAYIRMNLHDSDNMGDS